MQCNGSGGVLEDCCWGGTDKYVKTLFYIPSLSPFLECNNWLTDYLAFQLQGLQPSTPERHSLLGV